MPPHQMDVLIATLKRDQRLESLPLCCFEMTKGGNRELCLIDGHHRIRAAIAAKIQTIHVLVIERELSRQEIVSRQIAHNAITGYDDEEVLADMLTEIADEQLRYFTGLELARLKERDPIQGLKSTDIVPCEIVILFFAPQDRARWQEAIDRLASKAAPAEEIQVADLAAFEDFAAAIRQVCHDKKVTNVTVAINILSDLALKMATLPA